MAHSPNSAARQLITALRLKDFLFVQQIAEHGSLSSAASEFGMSQPAASRWLRELEQAFRAHLFTRDRMVGMTPTPLGQLVVERGRALLSDVSALSSEIEARRAGRGGRLQLGVIPYVSAQLLQMLVSTLVGKYAMTVSILEAPTEPLMEALRMQRLHAVIGRCSAQPLHSGLRQEVLFTQKACILVHAESSLRGGRQTKLSAFSGLRWIAPPSDSPSWQAIVNAYGAARSIPPQPVLETASTKLAHALVSVNPDMVAVLPLDVGVDLEKLGGVRALQFPAPFNMPPVGLIAQTRQWELSHVKALRDSLRKLVAVDGRIVEKY